MMSNRVTGRGLSMVLVAGAAGMLPLVLMLALGLWELPTPVVVCDHPVWMESGFAAREAECELRSEGALDRPGRAVRVVVLD